MMKLADKVYDVFNIPTHQIWLDSEFNCRDSFTLEDVVELAGSIKSEGLLFPIVVQPREDTYEMPQGFKYRLVCGFRRTEACKFLEWATMPCNVRTGLSERQAQFVNLTENLERKNLNILEEAKALDKIFPPHRTDQSIATELKKNRKWVSVRRKLMTVSDMIKQAVASGRLSARDLQAIIAHPDPDKLAKSLLVAGAKRGKFRILQRGKQRRNKAEVKALITEMLSEGFNPNIMRLLGWCIGEVDDEGLAEARRWLKDRKGWLK